MQLAPPWNEKNARQRKLEAVRRLLLYLARWPRHAASPSSAPLARAAATFRRPRKVPSLPACGTVLSPHLHYRRILGDPEWTTLPGLDR